MVKFTDNFEKLGLDDCLDKYKKAYFIENFKLNNFIKKVENASKLSSRQFPYLHFSGRC